MTIPAVKPMLIQYRYSIKSLTEMICREINKSNQEKKRKKREMKVQIIMLKFRGPNSAISDPRAINFFSREVNHVKTGYGTRGGRAS